MPYKNCLYLVSIFFKERFGFFCLEVMEIMIFDYTMSDFLIQFRSPDETTADTVSYRQQKTAAVGVVVVSRNISRQSTLSHIPVIP